MEKSSAFWKRFPEAVDMNTDCSRSRLGSRAPDVFHELQAGKDLVGIGEELVEQAEFFLRKDLLPAVGGDGEGVVIQDGISDEQAGARRRSLPGGEGL